MADIAFLLIIFFMLTAVFATTKGLQFGFPKDDPTQLDIQPEESIHIKIIAEGQFIVDKRPMSLNEMGGYIQAKTLQAPQKPVIIQTGNEVPYQSLIHI